MTNARFVTVPPVPTVNVLPVAVPLVAALPTYRVAAPDSTANGPLSSLRMVAVLKLATVLAFVARPM